MNKTLSNAILLRAKFRHKFFKNKSNENKKKLLETTEPLCFSSKENEKRVIQHLGEKNICDDKTSWKIVKPMLSKKIKSNKKIDLTENDEIIKTEKRMENF